MTRITVTLENGADSSLLKKMIENMRGVLRATVSVTPNEIPEKSVNLSTEAWIKKMRSLSDSIDTSIVDLEDERTRYLMSK